MGSTCRLGKGNGVCVTISQTVRRAASMTPPVVAKMSAAPVLMPSGASIFSSGRLRKSMPACLIMRAELTRGEHDVDVLRRRCRSSRAAAASNFLAVHGMTETTTMSSGFTPILSA